MLLLGSEGRVTSYPWDPAGAQGRDLVECHRYTRQIAIQLKNQLSFMISKYNSETEQEHYVVFRHNSPVKQEYQVTNTVTNAPNLRVQDVSWEVSLYMNYNQI